MTRRRWWCRLVGHRYIDPLLGYPIHIYLPSGERHPGGKLIGICACGEEWRRP